MKVKIINKNLLLAYGFERVEREHDYGYADYICSIGTGVGEFYLTVQDDSDNLGLVSPGYGSYESGSISLNDLLSILVGLKTAGVIDISF